MNLLELQEGVDVSVKPVIVALNTRGLSAPIFLNHNGIKSLYTVSPTFMKAFSSIVYSSVGDTLLMLSVLDNLYTEFI